MLYLYVIFISEVKLFNFFKIFNVFFLSGFMVACCVFFAADAAIVTSSEKHSEWNLGKHWVEIKTTDNAAYQVFMSIDDLQEIEALIKGEEIIIQNEQILFNRFGYSSFDLFIPRLNRNLIGEGLSTIDYTIMHEGKEVHALFELLVNQTEKSLSFIIESGERFKLFFENAEDLEGWHSGQEIDIVFEESLYEKNPLILLGIKNDQEPLYVNVPLLLFGIKNFQTNKEYFVKAEAFYRWQPREKDRYRLLTLKHRIYESWAEGEYWGSSTIDELFADDGKSYLMNGSSPGYVNGMSYLRNKDTPGKNGDKIMVLEVIRSHQAKDCVYYFYKFLNLRTGDVYIDSATNPDHQNFSTRFGQSFGQS